MQFFTPTIFFKVNLFLKKKRNKLFRKYDHLKKKEKLINLFYCEYLNCLKEEKMMHIHIYIYTHVFEGKKGAMSLVCKLKIRKKQNILKRKEADTLSY